MDGEQIRRVEYVEYLLSILLCAAMFAVIAFLTSKLFDAEESLKCVAETYQCAVQIGACVSLRACVCACVCVCVARARVCV